MQIDVLIQFLSDGIWKETPYKVLNTADWNPSKAPPSYLRQTIIMNAYHGLIPVYTVSYLRFIGQKGDVDLSQGLHGFGGAGFGQQSKQGVWDRCQDSQKNMVTDWDS